MRSRLAFVLGGGGSRGAMQVGAVRALIEAGLIPDLLVGTSIGAVNSAGLGIWGLNLEGVSAIEAAYERIQDAHLLEPRLGRLAMRTLSGRLSHQANQRARNFLIEAGILPDLQFGQIKNVSIGLVGSNLDTGKPVIYGQNPEQLILEGVMASIALPPWFAPIEKDGHVIVDGGALSILPIQPALQLGATEIIALDINDPDLLPQVDRGASQLIEKLTSAIFQREIDLEMELASARNVPVHLIQLRSTPPVSLWDFRSSKELIEFGYQIARRQISTWFKPGLSNS